jgi:phosphoesterase RecJ-like protein
MNPDGDALGSSRAAALLLRQLGKDVIVHISGAEAPHEYAFIADELIDSVPDDIAERVVLAVDCGNAERIKNEALLERAKLVLNIDHHGDNTHFGAMNHVRSQASCAAELVWELAGHLGITSPGVDVATAVYVGLVTDTGRFQYSNTTPEAHELAATLQRAGVDVHDVFSRIFETAPYARVKLLGRALERAIRSDDGLIVATHLRQQDFDECGAVEDDAEGVVDALRSVEGTVVAVFLRDLEPGGEHLRKGSLRTTREDIDVSVIARSWIGGGHRQAAGFNTADDLEAVVERVDAAIREQLGLDD